MKKNQKSQPLSLSLEEAIDQSVSSQEPENTSATFEMVEEGSESIPSFEELPSSSPSSKVDNELPEVKNKINVLEQQIQRLNAQNVQLTEAIKLTSQQNTQIIQAMQNMIVADGKGDNNAQPKPNAIPSTESQTGEQPSGSSIWLAILKEGNKTLAEFRNMINEAKQAGQPITNVSDEVDGGGFSIKAFKQMLTLFKGFSDAQNDIRNWAKTQIMADPVSQLELLSNPKFQRLLMQQLATLQPSPQPQPIRIVEEGTEGHL